MKDKVFRYFPKVTGHRYLVCVKCGYEWNVPVTCEASGWDYICPDCNYIKGCLEMDVKRKGDFYNKTVKADNVKRIGRASADSAARIKAMLKEKRRKKREGKKAEGGE